MIARRGIGDIVYGPAFGSIAARMRVARARVLAGNEIRLSSVVTASCRIRAHKLHGFAVHFVSCKSNSSISRAS